MAEKGGQKQNGTNSIAGLLDRFLECHPTVERLRSIDADFQYLCDEYQDCAAALRYWQQSPAPEASSLQGEYAALLQDLEEEILRYLEKSDQKPAADDR